MRETCWRLWDGSSFQRTLSLLSAHLFLSSGRRDLLLTVDVWRASDLGTTSSSRFYCLHYNWGRYFKTPLFEEPLPHPNRMAYLAMAN
uniref:Uncharacterized protein n=1 Tax=Fagus sylvatica TaxID=28930 RepID=A0A2N9GGF4_FAGSY